MDYQQNQQIEIQEDEDQIKSDVQVSQLQKMLEESRKFTLSFIEELKEKALTPISQQVLDHYHGQIKQNYSVKDIINIIDKRISKMIRNKKIKKNWNFDDIVLLLWFVSKYISTHQELTCQNLTNQGWKYISNLIPGSGPKGCMFKFISLKKIKLSLFNWSQEEENMLRQLVKYFYLDFRKLGQNKWKQISEYLYEHNPKCKIYRTSKQCRQHWNCYLDPKLKKGPWSEMEDVKLLENVRQNKGERKWSSIKYLFEGRTQNALKNRYNLLLQRQKKLTPNSNETELIRQYLKAKGSTQKHIDFQQISLNNDVQSEIQKLNLPHQIFEQAVDDSKNKVLTATQLQRQKSPQIFMKSQKSSFKLSEAYQKFKFQQQNCQKTQQNCQEQAFKNFIFANLVGIPSIMTNEQGFYTNFIYKSFYSS